MLQARQVRRHSCDETVDCEFQGTRRFAYLCDISMSGARLRGTELPEVGSFIRIAPTFHSVDREWVCGQVCWVRHGEVAEAGISFSQPSSWLQRTWVAELLGDDDATERRRSPRVPAEVHVEVRWEGGRLETTSVDLSEGGAQIRLPKTMRKGERAELCVCLPWCMIEVGAQVTRKASPKKKLHHSVRFDSLSAGDREALECFLKQQLTRTDRSRTSGASFLNIINAPEV